MLKRLLSSKCLVTLLLWDCTNLALAYSPEKAESPYFFKGHDLSSVKLLEGGGAIYRDTSSGNTTRPVEDILGDGGMNTVRLRLWVDPPDGVYGLNYTLDLAQRFASKGYKIYLDYHFSDTWADPGHQNTPTEWPTELGPLAQTLRHYVSSTMQSFQHAGVTLSLVSLGNEIRNGMLWPLGRADVDISTHEDRISSFTGLATLFSAARQGIDDAIALGVCRPEYIMIHIDNGWNSTLQETWFSSFLATGEVQLKDWDLFGLSFYPFYGTHATLDNLQTSVNTLTTKYDKPAQVVETDWPRTCSGSSAPPLSEPSVPVTPDGQVEWVQNIIKVMQSVPNELGRGVHYWEPAWLNNTGLGSACQSAILFDADYSNPLQYIGYSTAGAAMFLDSA